MPSDSIADALLAMDGHPLITQVTVEQAADPRADEPYFRITSDKHDDYAGPGTGVSLPELLAGFDADAIPYHVRVFLPVS